MNDTTINYGDVAVSIYDNHRGEKEVNIANNAENITLSISETRHLLVILLGLRQELLDEVQPSPTLGISVSDGLETKDEVR